MASKYVITAAHCMFDKEGKLRKKNHFMVWKTLVLNTFYLFFFQVFFGVYKVYEKFAVPVKKYTNHKQYMHDPTKTINSYDISIIELKRPVDLAETSPACMALTSDTTTFNTKGVWVYGEKITLNYT